MSAVLIRRKILMQTEHMERMPCEDGSRDQSDVFPSQPMIKISSKPSEARQEA